MKKQRRPTIHLEGFTITLYKGNTWIARKARKIVGRNDDWRGLLKDLKII